LSFPGWMKWIYQATWPTPSSRFHKADFLESIL
jgi:hypothetical protein